MAEVDLVISRGVLANPGGINLEKWRAVAAASGGRFPAKTKPSKSSNRCISNRLWPTNRSYRKQTVRPCLTGSRTAIKDSAAQLSNNPPKRTNARAEIEL
jgi:hypothetical protein